MADIDASHVLFPNDAPPSKAPDWFAAQKSAAEMRLMGQGQPKPAPDAAATIFPDDAKGENPPAEKPDSDAASTIFKDDATADYDKIVSGELDQYTLGAVQDGDSERAEALKTATTSLAENFKAAGTAAEELKDAFAIVRQSAGLAPPTPEQREESYDAGMAAIEAEGVSSAELNAARAFIRDLEIASPGVVASLNAHGAGNDPKLIRAAVREAARRGYR